MNQFNLRFYWSIFLRRLHIFIPIVLFTSGIGVFIAVNLPPAFQADAKILIESPQIATDLIRSAGATEAAKQLQLIELKLMTRADLVPLAEKFSLYNNEQAVSADEIVDDIRSRTKILPIESHIKSDGGTNAFVVSFTAGDPDTAANFVNEYVNLMLQRSASLRSNQASDTLQFFRNEAERLGLQLSDIEKKILRLKENNRDSLPESLSFRRSQQIAHQERIAQIEREEALLRDERTRLARVVLNPYRDSDPSLMTPKERMLGQLRQSLAEQRSVFSESSAGITALRSQIATLEKELETELASNTSGRGKTRGPSDLDVRLAEVSQRLTLAGQEKAGISAALAKLSASIAETPAIETELNALERERQNLQTQHAAAVARSADASTGQQIELGSKGERISLLEAAIPPQFPVSSKKRLVALGSVGLGFALAFGVVILMELLNKSIRRPQELFERLEIEPLATIPYIHSEGKQPKGRARAASALLLALATAPVLLYTTLDLSDWAGKQSPVLSRSTESANDH